MAKSTPNGGTAKERRVCDLTPAPYNPRKITDERLGALGRAMATFGDLSGVVFNRRLSRVVGGHQRLKLIPKTAQITVTESFSPATAQGTIAVGYIEVDGERWTYREVDWDEQTEMAANIAANKHGGEWDFPALPDLLSELDAQGFDMELTGFDEGELEGLLSGAGMAEPNLDPGADRYREQYGVIVVCTSETQQEEVYNKLHGEGYTCRVVTT